MFLKFRFFNDVTLIYVPREIWITKEEIGGGKMFFFLPFFPKIKLCGLKSFELSCNEIIYTGKCKKKPLKFLDFFLFLFLPDKRMIRMRFLPTRAIQHSSFRQSADFGFWVPPPNLRLTFRYQFSNAIFICYN